jgi:hypothetical protein
MREEISGSENGKNLMQTLFTSLEERLNNEEYEDAMNEFNDDLNVLTNNTDDKELSSDVDNLLNNVRGGIQDFDDEEDDEDDEEFLNKFR